MKNLKTTILTIIIAMCCYSNSNAQEAARGKTKGKITTIGDRGLILVLGGGLSSPSSEAKDKAFLSNATAINADLFLPILKKEGASYNFGINIGGTYSFGGSGGLGTLPNPYLVSGQTSSIVSDRCQCTGQAEFRMGAGPQANFYFGKFIVSPMVLAQYMSVTQKERSAVQTTVVGGQSYDFNLATLPETKTSGFAVTPKLRLHYMFSERFGLFADASYTMGPKAETVIRKLFPNGAPNTPTNDYDLQALQTANFENGKTKSTALNSMGFNFGVVIGLGGNGDNARPVPAACSCCGSKSHDRISCPDINNCGYKTATAIDKNLIKVQDDPIKAWDGTVKGLFEDKYAALVIPKNVGTKKILDKINKSGIGKASIEKLENKEYIKIIKITKEETITEMHLIDNSSIVGKTIIGGSNGSFSCANYGCTACKITYVSGVGYCGCDTTGVPPLLPGDPIPLRECRKRLPWGLSAQLGASSGLAEAFPIGTNASGTLTATSLNDIKKHVNDTNAKYGY